MKKTLREKNVNQEYGLQTLMEEMGNPPYRDFNIFISFNTPSCHPLISYVLFYFSANKSHRRIILSQHNHDLQGEQFLHCFRVGVKPHGWLPKNLRIKRFSRKELGNQSRPESNNFLKREWRIARTRKGKSLTSLSIQIIHKENVQNKSRTKSGFYCIYRKNKK